MDLKKLLGSFRLSKKLSWGIAGLLVLIILFLVMLRACSSGEGLHKNVYVIGRDSSWYGIDLLGREKALQAFMNDLMAEIGSQSGFRIQWLDTNHASLLGGLDAGLYDAMLSPLMPNRVNEEKYLFSELVFQTGPVLIVRKDSPVTTLDEMNGKSIGMHVGSSVIFNAVHELGFHEFDLSFISYLSINRGLDALVNNQVDGFILEAIPAYTFVEGLYHDKLKIVTPPLTDDGLRVIANQGKGESAFIEKFDEGLAKVKQNGIYQALIDKWNLINPETGYQKEKGL